MHPYTAPELNAKGFNCPHCEAYAEQEWFALLAFEGPDTDWRLPDWRLAWCRHCNSVTLWQHNEMVYPDASIAPMANLDMPDDIKSDFEEARSIITKSARGAAALFRLCIQKLCKHLGQPGKDLNDDIGALVAKGLSPKIQKSLDV